VTEKSEAFACARRCPVNEVVDPKKYIIRKKWRAEEEERHKGSLTPPKKYHNKLQFAKSGYPVRKFQYVYTKVRKHGFARKK
jgi:hypothetical protein